MSGPSPAGAGRVMLLGAALALVAGACAPRPLSLARLDRDDRRGRFETALEAREKRGRWVEAEISLWVRSERWGEFPGASAKLLLGAAACRLQVASAFGVLVDAVARGDTVMAHLPSERVAIASLAACESLGVCAPGGLIQRWLCASWRPPAQAWANGTWEDSLLVLMWRDPEETIRLSIGASGLPVAVTIEPRRGRPWHARYRGWLAVEGIRWPALLESEDGERRVSLTCRVHRLRFPRSIEAWRFQLRLPPRTEWLALSRVEETLRRRGVVE